MPAAPARRPAAVTLAAAGLIATVGVAYAGYWPDLVRGSKDWHFIALATFAGIAAVGVGLIFATWRRRAWLGLLLAGLAVVQLGGFLLLQRTVFVPERYFDHRQAAWAAGARLDDYELARAFLRTPATRALLARPDVRAFLVDRLDFASVRTQFELDDLAMPALLAWQAHRHAGTRSMAALLRQPGGLRVALGLVLNELRPLRPPVDAPEWPALVADWQLRPSEGLALGVLTREDARTVSAAALAHLQDLAVQEVELLTWLHTRVPLRLADEDFGRLVERLAKLKPAHADYLRALRTFRDVLCRATAGPPEGSVVALGGKRAGPIDMVPLLHTCGYLWRAGEPGTPLAVDTRLAFVELSRSPRYKPVYSNETVHRYDRLTRQNIRSTRSVTTYVRDGIETQSRVDFTLTLVRAGAVLASLQGMEVLGHRWFDLRTKGYTVEYAQVARKDSWLLTLPLEWTSGRLAR